MKLFRESFLFQWDGNNQDKNYKKHGVSNQECEEIFFDLQKKILKDVLHSDTENRYILLGKTRGKRILFVVFTVRKKYIRVISARDLNRKERYLYEKQKITNSAIQKRR